MKNTNGNLNEVSVIAPLLVGLALGAFAGILLAPEEGSVLRKKILKGKDEVREKINTGLEYAHSIAEEAEDFAYRHYNELTKIPVKRNLTEIAFIVAVTGGILGALFGSDKFKEAAKRMMNEAAEKGENLKQLLIHKN